MYWLIDKSVFDAIMRADHAAFSQAQLQLEARVAGSTDAPGSRIVNVAGNVARINVVGTMTVRPSYVARYYGGGNVTYDEIMGAIALAENDPEVTTIEFAVNSVGGQVDGLYEAMQAIRASTKPTRAIIGTAGLSAAYMLASQAGDIEATSIASRIGSVGLKTDILVSDNFVTITNTASPDKAPDVTTAEGRQVVESQLDAMYDIFVDAIADGRDTTVSKVNANFGKGSTLLAEEAQRLGMIDTIAGTGSTTESSQQTASDGNSSPIQAKNMTVEELRASHRETYNAIYEAGVAKERDRVSAHLILGEETGAMETAVAAVKEGTEMTATLNAKYQAAGLKKLAQANAQSDSDEATAGDNAQSQTDDDAGATSEQVISAIEERLGKPVAQGGN